MLTIFISPLVILIALVLSGIGFRPKARTLAINTLIIALLTLIPMLLTWISLFNSQHLTHFPRPTGQFEVCKTGSRLVCLAVKHFPQFSQSAPHHLSPG